MGVYANQINAAAESAAPAPELAREGALLTGEEEKLVREKLDTIDQKISSINRQISYLEKALKKILEKAAVAAKFERPTKKEQREQDEKINSITTKITELETQKYNLSDLKTHYLLIINMQDPVLLGQVMLERAMLDIPQSREQRILEQQQQDLEAFKENASMGTNRIWSDASAE